MKFTLKDVYEDFGDALLEMKEHYNVRTVHLFNKHNSYGGATIVYRPMLSDSKGFPQGKFAEVSIAWCAPGDRYDRKMGELVALSKMQNGESVSLPIYAEGTPVKQLRAMFEGMAMAQNSEAFK